MCAYICFAYLKDQLYPKFIRKFKVLYFFKLCSKGAALGKPFEASAEDIASVASFIETKLVTCYLRMRKPDLALNHAHR